MIFHNSIWITIYSFHSLNEEKVICAESVSQASLKLGQDIKKIRHKLLIDKRNKRVDYAHQLKDVSMQCARLKKAELSHFEDKKKLKSSQAIEKLEAELSFAQNRYSTFDRCHVCLFGYVSTHLASSSSFAFLTSLDTRSSDVVIFSKWKGTTTKPLCFV